MRVKSWTRMMEGADGMGAKRKLIQGETFCMHWSIRKENEIMAAISYGRGVLVEGIQEGYNKVNSSQEVAWGLCAKRLDYYSQSGYAVWYAIAGMNESSLHREGKSRRGSRVETRWINFNGKDNIAITDND